MIVLWISSLLLLELCSPVLSQLGEIKPSVATVEPSKSSSPDYYDEIVYDHYDGPDIILNSDVGWSRIFSRPVMDTYQGCLQDTYIFNATYIYFNLTEEAKKNFSVSNDAEACFKLCQDKDPFSFFISVNAGIELGQSKRLNNDACGCHAQDEVDLDKVESDDINCDTSGNLARIYCGPENIGCINAASFIRSLSAILLLLCSFLVLSEDLR